MDLQHLRHQSTCSSTHGGDLLEEELALGSRINGPLKGFDLPFDPSKPHRRALFVLD
jgi:hypothetical protein